MEKSFEEWMDTFIEVAQVEGYHGPIDKDAFFEEYENDVDAYWAAKNFVAEMKEPVCPECLTKCSSSELEMFGGFCEECAGDD